MAEMESSEEIRKKRKSEKRETNEGDKGMGRGEGNGNPLQCSCLENPRDAEPGGLPSMGSHRVGHD